MFLVPLSRACQRTPYGVGMGVQKISRDPRNEGKAVFEECEPCQKGHANECKVYANQPVVRGSLDSESPASLLASPSLYPKPRLAVASSLTHKTTASKGQYPVLLGC